MNTKLTLSLNKMTIKKAKKYAEKHGTSLSKMVQGYFEELSLPKKDIIKITPLVESLLGSAKRLRDIDFHTAKTEYLTKKYLK